MLRRVAFGKYELVKPEPAPLRPVERAGVIVRCGAGVIAVPKTVPQRNRRLLDMAERKPCLLLVPGWCNHRIDTTCACHSNQGIHGKAGARKADDQWSVWGCSACHWWLDFGPASQEQKNAVFDAAHVLQLLAWEQIEADQQTPQADRRAVRWALERSVAS